MAAKLLTAKLLTALELKVGVGKESSNIGVLRCSQGIHYIPGKLFSL